MHAIPISTFAGGRPLFNLIVYRLSFSSDLATSLPYVSDTFTVHYSTLLIVAKKVSICSIIYLICHYEHHHVCIIRSQCDGCPNTVTVPIKYSTHGPLFRRATFNEPSSEPSSSHPVRAHEPHFPGTWTWKSFMFLITRQRLTL